MINWPAPDPRSFRDVQRNFDSLNAYGLAVRIIDHTPTDDDFDGSPPDGISVIDSSTNRLYFRVLGTWRYVALT